QHYFNNDVWQAYESFAVIEVLFSVQDDEMLTVIADEMSVPPHVHFEENLCRRINERKKRLAIAKALRIRSKGCDLLQLADLLVGAVAYDYKISLGTLPAPPSAAKLEMLKLVKNGCGATDFMSGYRASTSAGRKVRVRVFNAKQAPEKKIAGHGPSGATPATPTTVGSTAAAVNVTPDVLHEPPSSLEELVDDDADVAKPDKGQPSGGR
ncbi:MAG: hypothetical protein M3O99_01525, partial [Chloroflexota bacterium]|nr:hypothetical protein [Chloroflexota bacterium]